jgi:AcrR family transcriptional regulator
MHTGPAMPPAPTRPVGRGPKVRAAVLAATLAELTAAGYAALTVDNVARRAGVHKTTVYRRWPDRERLVADALIDAIARDMPVPDTGTVEGDLRALARALVGWLSSPTGDAIIWTMLSAGHVPEIAGIKRRFFEDRLRRDGAVVARAVARDELPADTDAAQVIKALVAPIYLRLLVTAEPIDGATADHAARVALAAARAGALGPARAGDDEVVRGRLG